MSVSGNPLPAVLTDVGLWIGFGISLLIFSAILGDNLLARLAQYLLVGSGLGYLAVLAWKDVLWPRLFVPLLSAPMARPWQWAPLGLGVLIWLAGWSYLRRPAGQPEAVSQHWLRWLGVLPAALMVGVALGVGVAGAIQGTLWPQFRRAAAVGASWEAGVDLLLAGVLALLITGGSLLFLHVDAEFGRTQPLGRLIQAWRWIGQRTLWLAAGVIFARLVAARFSLLIARFDYLLFGLGETELGRWLGSILGR